MIRNDLLRNNLTEIRNYLVYFACNYLDNQQDWKEFDRINDYLKEIANQAIITSKKDIEDYVELEKIEEKKHKQGDIYEYVYHYSLNIPVTFGVRPNVKVNEKVLKKIAVEAIIERLNATYSTLDDEDE